MLLSMSKEMGNYLENFEDPPSEDCEDLNNAVLDASKEGDKEESRRTTYTREELLKYQKSPLSMVRPKIDHPDMICWKREAGEEDLKRRTGDPRERTRRENDGIILSPQRGGNFKLGCSMLPSFQIAPTQPTQRRIGSGRLLTREWDGAEDKNDFDESFGNMGRRKKFNSFSSDGDNRGKPEKHGRQPNGPGIFRIDAEQGRPDGRNTRQGRPTNGHSIFQLNQQGQPNRQRQAGDRRSNNSSGYTETPEWFTEGPTSRHERIDLHGFDVPTEETAEHGKQINDSVAAKVNKPTTPPEIVSDVGVHNSVSDPSKEQNSLPTKAAVAEDFNFDDFLQFDVLSPLLADIDAIDTERSPAAEEPKATQSKFSQFFNSQVPRHAQHADLGSMKVVTEGGEAGTWTPQNENVPNHADDGDAAAAFISAFCREQPHRAFGSKLKDLAETLKIPSVDELEAHVLASASQAPNARGRSPNPDPHEEDRNASRHGERRLFQAQQALQQAQQQGHQQRQQQLLYAPHFREGLPPMPHDLHYMVASAAPTPDIVTRTDYLTIIAGVKQGVINPQHLVNLLLKANAVMHPRQREVLLCVLNVIWTSHRAGSPISGGVPSRGDLVAHTANIMQNALIKKKLEEQLENYKKRQDIGDSSRPPRNPSPNTQAQSSLAFTPTAVLRKMTAAGTAYGPDVTQPPPPNASSPQPLVSPLRASPTVHLEPRTEGLGPMGVIGHNFGAPGPLSPAMMQGPPPNMQSMPNIQNMSPHFNNQMPIHMVQPPSYRPPIRYSPQAFIGQFVQARNSPRGNAPGDGQWWTPEAMARVVRAQVPGPNVPQRPQGPQGLRMGPRPNEPLQMMTVEELERSQQRSTEDTDRRGRRGRRQ